MVDSRLIVMVILEYGILLFCSLDNENKSE